MYIVEADTEILIRQTPKAVYSSSTQKKERLVPTRLKESTSCDNDRDGLRADRGGGQRAQLATRQHTVGHPMATRSSPACYQSI